MITPAYSPTATERVLPRLALDFTTGVLDSRVTVVRALNTATAVNSSGYIAGVNANLPRFDYNPSTLAPRGLLIEEARANIFLQSEALSSPWVVDGGASLNATPTAAPDNANTAKKLQENSANTYFRIYQGVTLSTSTSYTLSVFGKPDGRDWVYIYANGGLNTAYVNFATKTVGTQAGTNTIRFVDYKNGFVRVEMTYTNTTAGGQNVQVWLAQADNVRTYQGDGTSGCYLWGFQLEAGAFATSYIPTVAASVTRNADVVSMTGTNFSSWYNASAGAIQAVFQTYVPAGQSANIIAVEGAAGANMTVYSDAGTWRFRTNLANMNLNAGIIQNGVNNHVFCYAASDYKFAGNGTPIQTNSGVGSIAGLNTLVIGGGTNYGAAKPINGWVQRVDAWPQRLINNEIVAFSK